MSGDAKTTAMMLGNATVMIGPQSSLYDLQPSIHSLGLAKNFKISADPSYTKLTQGVKNTTVMSVLTSNAVKASMEIYEASIANLQYGLGLDGSVNDPTTYVAAVAAAAATSITLNDGTYFNNGDTVTIVKPDGTLFKTKLSAKAGNVFTVTPVVPTGGLTPPGGLTSLNTVGKVTGFRAASTVGTLGTGTPAVPSTTVALVTGGAADFKANDWVMIQIGTDDKVLIRQIASIATDTLTLTRGINQALPVGTSVTKVFYASVGSKLDQPFFSAKVIGTLADGSEVALLIPKVRISKGFELAFSSGEFGNLPLEFDIYDLVSSDPFYTEFNGDQARIFSAT
jgi:hypothetical protein